MLQEPKVLFTLCWLLTCSCICAHMCLYVCTSHAAVMSQNERIRGRSKNNRKKEKSKSVINQINFLSLPLVGSSQGTEMSLQVEKMARYDMGV